MPINQSANDSEDASVPEVYCILASILASRTYKDARAHLGTHYNRRPSEEGRKLLLHRHEISITTVVVFQEGSPLTSPFYEYDGFFRLHLRHRELLWLLLWKKGALNI